MSAGPAFARYIGIDYSGADTLTSSLKGLRIYLAQGDTEAEEVLPLPSPRKYWTRLGVVSMGDPERLEGALRFGLGF
jgi:hypothetical protein